MFNEEAAILSSIQKNIQVLKKHPYSFEIIIVDDASTDNSYSIVYQNFGQFDFIKIVQHHKNSGIGGAVNTGIRYSEGENIWVIPVDSPLNNKLFTDFEAYFSQADILVSYRIKRKGYSRFMLFNSSVFHWLVSHLFGIQLKDYNWIHLYKRKIFAENGIIIEYDSIFMLAEVLIKAHKKNMSFIEFPVNQEQRLTGIASASKPINIYRTMRDMIKLKLRIIFRMV